MLSVALRDPSMPPSVIAATLLMPVAQKTRLIAAALWIKMLFFTAGQISDIHVTGESEDMTAKERLLFWSKQITDGYVGVRCDNFTTSWRDGRLFNAIIHRYR